MKGFLRFCFLLICMALGYLAGQDGPQPAMLPSAIAKFCNDLWYATTNSIPPNHGIDARNAKARFLEQLSALRTRHEQLLLEQRLQEVEGRVLEKWSEASRSAIDPKQSTRRESLANAISECELQIELRSRAIAKEMSSHSH